MSGGAWPFLVGGVICLVNSDNERDRCLLNSRLSWLTHFIRASCWPVWFTLDGYQGSVWRVANYGDVLVH